MSSQEILNLDKNEQVLLDIRRHPIGLVWIYGTGIVAIITLLIVLFVAVRSADGIFFNLSDFQYAILFGILTLMVAAVTFVGAMVYRMNELVVTNENIIQVLQYSLLGRQISQLNLAKIQDVSVDQIGLLTTLFNYGTIEIETAGEAANFKFDYTSDPSRVAKIIIEAHEDYMRKARIDGSTHYI